LIKNILEKVFPYFYFLFLEEKKGVTNCSWGQRVREQMRRPSQNKQTRHFNAWEIHWYKRVSEFFIYLFFCSLLNHKFLINFNNFYEFPSFFEFSVVYCYFNIFIYYYISVIQPNSRISAARSILKGSKSNPNFTCMSVASCYLFLLNSRFHNYNNNINIYYYYNKLIDS